MRRLYSGLGLFCLFLFPAFTQQNFSRGEELFLQNKPQEALVFLEAATAEDPSNLQAVIYLGITYEQLGRFDDAIGVYLQFLPQGGSKTAQLALNLGNAYFAKGENDAAKGAYTRAIEAAPDLGRAYLNRANTRIRLGELREALTDYETFLTLNPGSPQRQAIEQLIAFIRAEFAAEERRRLLEEARAAEDAERRRRLLEEVSASLQSAAEETQGLSAGTEDTLDYEGEFELE